MGNNIQSFKSTIENANKVLLILPHIMTTDVCASVGLMYKLLRDKMQKDVDVAASRAVPSRFHDILKTCGIEVNKIFTEIKPVSYVIRVNDTKDRVDIEWQKKTDNIEVVLTPDKEEIDFSKVSFSKEGGIYDAVITFNALRLEDLGRIYSDFEKLYSRYEIVAVNHQGSDAEYAKVSLNDENVSTTSEVLYRIYDELGYQIESVDADIVAHGIIGSTYGLHQVQKGKTYKTVSELANKYNVDISSITTKYFYSTSKEGLKLRERLLRNVRYDDARKTVYSTLSSRDFSETHVSPQDLDGMDYLPFNICKEYDIAFLAYEEGGRSHVLVHSNKKTKDLTSILKKVNGVGDKLYGVVTFNSDANAASNSMLQAIWGGAPVNQPAPVQNNTPAQQTTGIPVPPAPEKQQKPQPDNAIQKEQSPVPESSIQSNTNVPTVQQVTTSAAPSAPAPVASNVQPIQQAPVNTAVPAPQQPAAPTNAPTSSPFQQANDFAIDDQAQPMKVSQSFSGTNTPFDPAS
jgi:nanoRNase/pAp phosphatase (c-di-AMP/oligoRNAs hydrolase)